VLVGETSEKIIKAVEDEYKNRIEKNEMPIIQCSNLEEAVKKAFDGSIEGDIITLSPASASFDMFKNFEERGDAFKQIVNSL
jgi:UDP-N-acetylmuramoylalanine--D-glutamate ligase